MARKPVVRYARPEQVAMRNVIISDEYGNPPYTVMFCDRNRFGFVTITGLDRDGSPVIETYRNDDKVCVLTGVRES